MSFSAPEVTNRSRFSVQDLSFVLTAKEIDPVYANYDLLRGSRILNKDWRLHSQGKGQLHFGDNLGIRAKPGQIVFIETIGSKDEEEILIPKVVAGFVHKFPQLDYQSFSINLTGIVLMREETAIKELLCDRLLGQVERCWSNQTLEDVRFQLVYSPPESSTLKEQTTIELSKIVTKVGVGIQAFGSFHFDCGGISSRWKAEIIYWQRKRERFGEYVEKLLAPVSIPLSLFSSASDSTSLVNN